MRDGHRRREVRYNASRWNAAWDGYDGGQGLGTEGGAFIDQLLVALRRGGIGAMMLRTVRRSCRTTDTAEWSCRYMVAAAAATATAKTGTETVEEGGGARGREKKVGGGTRRRRSERGGRRRRQGITGRAESEAAARDEGERTCYHATSEEHLTIFSANP